MIDAIVYSSLSGSCEEYAQRMSAALHIPFFTEKSGLCRSAVRLPTLAGCLPARLSVWTRPWTVMTCAASFRSAWGIRLSTRQRSAARRTASGSDIAVFPLQGRFDLKRLPLPYRLIMKIKIKDIAKRLNAKAAKTTLTAGEQACLTMATLGHGEPATWDGINDAIAWDVAHSFHSKFPEPKVC